MKSTRSIAVLSLVVVLSAGALGACGGSGSKSSTSESSGSSAQGSSSESSTTTAPTSTTGNVVIDIVYKSCNGSTLTVATAGGTGEITAVAVDREDATKTLQRNQLTKNADGTWTGTIPSGAGYNDRITVVATSSTGRKSSRSSPLPLQLQDGSTGTCS